MEAPLRILIVEDVPTDAELALAELRRSGLAFTSRLAETREAFLAALGEFRPQVIISDFSMPVFDGMDALRLAQAHAPLVPFIIYTGSLNEETAVECMKAGAWDYVIKDRLSRLPAAVQGALDLARTRAERTHAEDSLRDSERRYRLIAENTADVIWTLDPMTGRLLYVSPSVEKLRGFTAAEVMARPFEDALTPESAARVKELLSSRIAAIAAGEEWDRTAVLEVDQPTRSGEVVPTEVSATVITDASGNLKEILGVTRDLRERRRASEEQRRLATAVEQVADAVVITDPAGTIQYVNPSFSRITGYSAAEAIGGNPRILKSGRHERAFYADMWTTVSSGGIWSGRLVNRRKDGSLYEEEMTISPIRDARGGIVNFVAVKRDVTREAELQEQLNHAQKMEAVGRLAGGIAHDFNNLLQAMLSQVTVLRQKVKGQESAVRSLDELDQLVQRGAAMPRQLLLFARRETAVPRSLDLNDVVRQAATLLRRVVPENVVIATDLAPVELPVVADHGQLDQVLMNLVVNASDAMPEGGRVVLRTGRGEEAAWFAVGDSGPGIPDDIRARMFEPFFTTKPTDKGTGLGLSVVHGIVAAHGGRIEVSTREGRGARFTVVLPLARGGVAPAEAQRESGDVPPGRGERLLLVEDEEGARVGLAEILSLMSYEVTATATGEEALALPAARPFDVLLTDLLLPGISGVELAMALEERWPDLKVVLMSGYNQDDAVRTLAAGGVVRFLQKPFDMPTLAVALRSAIEEPDER